MNIEVQTNELKIAVAALQFYFSGISPFVSFATRGKTLWLYGTDMKALFSAISLEAPVCDVLEEGNLRAIPGSMLKEIINTVSTATVSLRTTETSLFVETKRGMRTRLQARLSEMADGILEKFEENSEDPRFTTSCTLMRDDVQRLVQLSKAFPAFTPTNTHWSIIEWGENGVTGHIQDNEAGAVEALPFESGEHVGSGRIAFLTDALINILKLPKSWCTFRTGAEEFFPVHITDPEFPSWWSLSSQYLTPGDAAKYKQRQEAQPSEDVD